jgi:hypothetical protein
MTQPPTPSQSPIALTNIENALPIINFMGANNDHPDWENDVHQTFDCLNIPEDVLQGIYTYGFERPSAIQQRGINPTILGRDVIAQAQVGTVRIYIRNVAKAIISVSPIELLIHSLNSLLLLSHLLYPFFILYREKRRPL